MTSGRARHLRLVAFLGAAALCGPAAAAGSALDLYYERTLMTAADGRCRLFEPALGAALASAQAQARGAALRSGATEDTIASVRLRAQAKAAGTACTSPDLNTVANRVREAFAGFSRLQKMTYAGDLASWQADRAASATLTTWRLSQTASIGPDRAVFGLAGVGRGQAVMASATFADGAWPYAARLTARDPARTPRPVLGRLGAGPVSRLPLAQRVPPRAVSRVILAQARSMAEPLILPKGAKTGVQFRFPPETVALLQGLDPREAVILEFVFAGRGRDEIRSAYVEVGDFAAGEAFLRVASR